MQLVKIMEAVLVPKNENMSLLDELNRSFINNRNNVFLIGYPMDEKPLCICVNYGYNRYTYPVSEMVIDIHSSSGKSLHCTESKFKGHILGDMKDRNSEVSNDNSVRLIIADKQGSQIFSTERDIIWGRILLYCELRDMYNDFGIFSFSIIFTNAKGENDGASSAGYMVYSKVDREASRLICNDVRLVKKEWFINGK